MDAFPEPVPAPNSFGRRLRKRGLWLFLCATAAGAAIFIGLRWLGLETQCPQLFKTLLFAITLPVAAIVGLNVLLTKNNAPVALLLQVGIIAAVGLIAPTVAASVAYGLPGVPEQFCPCPDVDRIQTLRRADNLPAADGLARDCMASTNTVQCRVQCECELARVLYDQAANELDAATCTEASESLIEGRTLAAQCNDPSFILAYEASEQAFNAICTAPLPTQEPTPILPTDTPTPVPTSLELEVLRNSEFEGRLVVDIRPFEGAEVRTDLPLEDFSVLVNGENLPIEVELRRADDPICAMAVVDNSGSIAPGLEDIRMGINTLNDARKPGDLLGMVLFTETASVAQVPGEAPLNANLVNGNGNLTGLWRGIDLALDTMQSCPAEAARYLIVLTDGQNNVFETDDEDKDNLLNAREIAQKAASQDTNICTIGVRATGQLDEQSLKLAGHNCGFYPVDNFDELQTQLRDVFGFVRDFYRITFDKQALDGQTDLLILYDNDQATGEVQVDLSQ